MAVATATSIFSSPLHASAPQPLGEKPQRHRCRIPRPAIDRADRASFSSVKENKSGVAQSFTHSKTSSYLRRGSEDAVEDSPPSSGCSTPRGDDEIMLPLTNPHSALAGFVCPCEGFRGWKQIKVLGKTVSRSSGDLRALAGSWEWEARKEVMKDDVAAIKDEENESSRPGNSPFERLPMELLGSIIDRLAMDIPPNGFTARNVDLMSLLLTSRGLHIATLATLYSNITIPHSRIFRKFLDHVSGHQALGTIVRRMDFSHFNPTGIGLSARERAQTQNLTPSTLLQCLNLTPNLREFLAQEHIDDELDVDVLQKVLYGLPKLQAIDFCACSSTSFRSAFTSVLDARLSEMLSLTRVSLHECANLPSSVFETLISRLPHLTHLDVAHTRITDTALASLPRSARLTHLNLSRCSFLSGSGVVTFLATHPAAKDLVYLNLMMDPKSHEMFSAEDLSALIPILPSTLKSLNLKGSKMSNQHIPQLRPLTKHLEELGLGRHLNLNSLISLLLPAEDAPLAEKLGWIPHTLRYIDVSDLSPSELDLSTLFSSSCPILKSFTQPLEVLEVQNSVYIKLEKGAPAALKRVGWCVTDAGRRGWLVRDRAAPEAGESRAERRDTGERDWKWGATYWGMRKCPVARGEVGGMYGLYMFKR